VVLGAEQRSSGWRPFKPGPRPVGSSLLFIAPLQHTSCSDITPLYINLIDIMSEYEDYITSEDYTAGGLMVRFALFGDSACLFFCPLSRSLPCAYFILVFS
jgi:hypothetical protein